MLLVGILFYLPYLSEGGKEMTPIEIFLIVAALFGGLALFLFGMTTMGAALGKMTGGFLDKVSGFITKNRFSAFLFGAGLTAIVQSSSAITVLSVGLVNAGIIGLSKAIGLIIGANLGTTATAWVLSLNALDGQSFIMTLFKPSSFSPFLAIIGIALTMFAHSEKRKNVGYALLGFSVMMIGMNMMSQGVSPLRDVPALQNMLIGFSNPILGFGFALLFTMLIQSSDATIGILQAFAITIGIAYGSAIPLICGAHVGTCITALLSSMGATNNGKRTAVMNLYYNLLKTLPLLIIFYLLNGIFHFGFLNDSVGAVGIPLVHTLINVIGALVWMPAANVLVSLAQRTIKLSKEELEEQENRLAMLDPLLLANPSFALKQADTAVSLLAETTSGAFNTLSHYKTEPDFEETIRTLCRRSESYQDQINHYLTLLSAKGIRQADAPLHTLLLNANVAFSQIGSITKQILEEGKQIFRSEIPISEDSLTELRVFADAIYETIDITILGFQRKDPTLSSTVQLYREEITRLITLVNLRHIENMHRGNADHSNFSLLTDVLYAEERLIDCCDVVADAILKYAEAAGTNKKQPADEDAKRTQIRRLFEDKYTMLGL